MRYFFDVTVRVEVWAETAEGAKRQLDEWDAHNLPLDETTMRIVEADRILTDQCNTAEAYFCELCDDVIMLSDDGWYHDNPPFPHAGLPVEDENGEYVPWFDTEGP